VSPPSEHPREPVYRHPAVVAIAIFTGGLVAIVGLLIWAIASSQAPAHATSASPAAAPADAMASMQTPAASTPASSTPTPAKGAAPAKTVFRDPALPALEPGTVHHYTIRLADETFAIAPGVRYQGWTFDTHAPGPVIHVRQGDTVDVILINGGAIPHSIDFHAAMVAPDQAFATIPHGGKVHFRFRADTPGAFMYHCGTPPVLAHIANGMYGAIVVDPKVALPPVAKSYVLVSGEWYMTGDGTSEPATLDMEKARQIRPDYVTFNGVANQYKDHPLTADPGDTVRFYVVDAGPSLATDFHVVGSILDTVYLDGTTTNVLHGVQTEAVPPGGGMVFDVKFPVRGIYPFVSHAFAAVDMGELGLINVGNVPKP
jgi:nitrite reductase (NO-forming)